MTPAFCPYFLNSNYPSHGQIHTSEAFFDAIFGNTGNSLITWAMLKFLGTGRDYLTAENALPNMFSARLSADESRRISQRFSHVLLTMQDYVRADWPEAFFINALHNLSGIQLPVIAYSLGANAFGGNDNALHQKLLPAQSAFLKLVAQRSVSIAVRGEYTADILARMGIHNTVVTGCPTYYLKGRNRQLRVAAWDGAKKIGATGLFAHADSERLHYYFQDERIFAKCLYFDDDYTREDFLQPAMEVLRKRQFATYAHSVLHALSQRRASLFIDMQAWEDDIAQRVNMVIGSRVHGAIMALNGGIPAVITSADARAAEMCALFKIPHYPEGISPDAVLEKIHLNYDPSPINQRYAELYDGWKIWMEAQGIPQGWTAQVDDERTDLKPPYLNALSQEKTAKRLQILLAQYQSEQKKPLSGLAQWGHSLSRVFGLRQSVAQARRL